LDTQQDIESAAVVLAKEKSCNFVEALNMLLSKYQSDRRIEEAHIVNKLIERELEKTGKEGFYDES
jgi:predicted acetyltransferase